MSFRPWTRFSFGRSQGASKKLPVRIGPRFQPHWKGAVGQQAQGTRFCWPRGGVGSCFLWLSCISSGREPRTCNVEVTSLASLLNLFLLRHLFSLFALPSSLTSGVSSRSTQAITATEACWTIEILRTEMPTADME